MKRKKIGRFGVEITTSNLSILFKKYDEENRVGSLSNLREELELAGTPKVFISASYKELWGRRSGVAGRVFVHLK